MIDKPRTAQRFRAAGDLRGHFAQLVALQGRLLQLELHRAIATFWLPCVMAILAATLFLAAEVVTLFGVGYEIGQRMDRVGLGLIGAGLVGGIIAAMTAVVALRRMAKVLHCFDESRAQLHLNLETLSGAFSSHEER